MTLPTLTQAFGQQGSADSPIYYWPENSEVVASAARFNEINQALYGFIKQLESETGTTLTAHENTLADHTTTLLQQAAALANRYTKAEADATTQALTTAIQTAQTALDNLNSLYQTDAEATAALTALSEQWNATSADFQATVAGWMNARYTKTETDNLLAQKADNGDSYTRGEADQLLSQKAAATHNHTLKVGNGAVEMFQVGTQERIDFKPGHGISLAFDDNLNQITVSTDLAADFTVSEQNIIGLLRDNVSADGDTLAKLRALIAALETALTADDVNLDTLQEVITRIKSDEGLITSLTSGKVNVSDIIDSLTSTASNKPLSAAQGHALKGLIDSLETATATALAARYSKAEADAAISGAVATETTRAQNAETALSTAIAEETTRAQAAEATRYTKAEADALLLNKADQASTYTKAETVNLMDTRIQAVVGTAPAALDTLQEIAAQLASDESAAAALTNTVAGKASAVHSHSLPYLKANGTTLNISIS